MDDVSDRLHKLATTPAWRSAGFRVLVRSLRKQLVAFHSRLLLRPRAPVRFVIFGQGRSGSSLLVDLLDSHPDIYCEGEHLHVTHNVFFGAPSVLAFADGRSRMVGAQAYGFKFKIYQLFQQGIGDPQKFLNDLHAQGWKIIHLRRQNVLRQVLSNFVLERRGHPHLMVGKQIDPNLFPFRVDPHAALFMLEDRIRLLKQESEVLRNLPHLEIVYERDLAKVSDREISLNRILDFLGLSHQLLSTKLQRVSSDNIRDMVENYDELQAEVVARGHSRFLD